MPDPTRKTVSATEISALFGESPYSTKWTLYQQFANGEKSSFEEDDRMRWGTLMQPLIAKQAAKDHGFIVEENEGNKYVSRGVLGCTRDAIIVDPERGPGALEVKCCFDYRTWMDTWSGGDRIPRHIVLQIQQQCFVGDGDAAVAMWPETAHKFYSWGLLAVWVCAKMYYFRFDAQPDLWETMTEEARMFLYDVEHRREPDPAGSVLELPLLAKVYPTVSGKVIDWRDRDEALPLVTKVATYLDSKKKATLHAKVAESIRAEFIGIMKDHERLMLPNGARVSLSSNVKQQRRIDVWMPEEK